MRIGLFLSSCGGMLDHTLNLNELAEKFTHLMKTMIVGSFESSKDITEIIKFVQREELDGVILAGNSPEEYTAVRQGNLLMLMLEQAGVNSNKVACVNLKKQVAGVHKPGKAAQAKAEVLIKVGLAKVLNANDVQVNCVSPRKTAAILGLSAEGWLVAQQLLKRDIRIYLINPPDFREDLPVSLAAVKAFVELHPKAKILEGYTLTDLYGWAGDMTIKLETGEKQSFIEAGAVLVAANNKPELVAQLRPILHLELDDDNGLFTPLAAESRAVETIEEGIFIIPDGIAVNMAGRVTMADSAAIKIINLLEQPELQHKNLVSEVDVEKCGGCGTCVKTCGFKASSIDPLTRVSKINIRRCKGCGNCVTSCPTGARDLLSYPQQYLLDAIEILAQFGEEGEPKILTFLCEGCGYKAFDEAAEQQLIYAENVLPLGVRCGGTIDMQLILEAFVKGFDGVTICKCADGHCRNIVGDTDLERRANLFREILRSRGINDDRLRIVESRRQGDNQCVNTTLQLLEDIKSGEVNGDEL